MITLHRLGHPDDPFYVNRDLIMTIDANPDTIVTLTTGDRLVVDERPELVAELVRQSRADVAALALRRRGGLQALKS